MEKRKKIVLIFLSIIILLLLVSSTLFIIYDLYLFTGILNFYRIIGSIIISFITLLLGQELLISLKKKKTVRYITFLIIALIYSFILIVGGYYVYKIISNLDDFNKNENIHSVSLITFSKEYKTLDKLDNLKIGIIEDTTDISNYILATEFISINKLEDYNQIIKYTSTLELLTALYKGEVDAIFINSDYSSLYGKLEEYKDIEEKAIVIKKYEKNVEDIDTNIIDNDEEKKLTDPFTILLLGIDSENDGLNPNVAFNGDTIMMITFNPNNLNATMFSIPRDTYVPISCSGNRINKINTAAYGGASCVVKTVENLTGIKIDYFAMINFKGVVSLVDTLGGITVDVPNPDFEGDFCAGNSSRGENICLTPGLQVLDGEHALVLARIRHSFVIGDFQRGQNQQLVVEGILNKIKDVRSVNTVIKILDIINKNIYTNLSREQILSFYEVGKKMIVGNNTNLLNIQKTFLTGYDMNVYEPASGGVRYAFFHYKQSLNSIVTAMKENLGLIEVTPIKTFSFSINEIYEKEIIGYKYYYGEARYPVVPTFYSITDAINWANSNGLPINIIESGTNNIITENYSNYSIAWQNEVPNTLVVRISSINIYVTKKLTNTSSPVINDEDDEDETSTSSGSETSSKTED